MNADSPLPNEAARLSALYRYDILDTEAEAEFDDIARLAAHLCAAPVAMICMVDRDRQWFKSEFGLGRRETSLNLCFCLHAIRQPGLLMVSDTTLDERFKNNPLVAGDPHLRFYAGAPLESADGMALGTLCVLDHVPRQLTAIQGQALRTLARLVMTMLELRLARRQLQSLTDTQSANEKIREQATLLDKAQDAILVRDLDHRVMYWNHSAERLYGWTTAEAMGQSVENFLYRDARSFRAAMETTLVKGEWMGEMQKWSKGGQSLNVEARWTLVRDETGAPKSILAIDTDITERKRLEQQFLRAQRMESIGTLAGGIAHDLNNVLAPIMLSIEMLKLGEKDPHRRGILSTIESSAARGASMVRQVLSFAEGVRGQKLEVSIAHLLEEIARIANETFLKNIAVRTRLPPDLWGVQGDPTQLHQVLLNLCINARDVMPQGGTLTLSASNVVLDDHYAGMNIDAAPGPHVLIQVEDTGSGIEPQVMERIFEPFFTTKDQGKGTGLGLSTSLAIVKSHGGFARVYSEPGAGTKFNIYLPASATPAPAHDAPAEIDLPRGNGELVLVVDDEASVRLITRQTLEAFGYRVLLACDGAEAVALYAMQKDQVAVVLTDMMMPLMDGPSTIQVLMRMNPQVQIIAASGLNTNALVAKAASAGVRHFLPKPYTAEAILVALNLVLRT